MATFDWLESRTSAASGGEPCDRCLSGSGGGGGVLDLDAYFEAEIIVSADDKLSLDDFDTSYLCSPKFEMDFLMFRFRLSR